MKPLNLKTKIFLDSCDPEETKEAISILGFLDGQTTNPTLVSKNPYAKERFEKGEKFTKKEILDFYKKVISEISELIPDGSVSVEVYADENSTSEELLSQGREMSKWIPNAHVKYPITKNSLIAVEQCIKENIKVNMTLCFNELQAGAVYQATLGAKKGDVFLSPFIGRLDDRGENGMSLIKNIQELYKKGDEHVEILAASARSIEHFLCSLSLGVDIITVPLSVIKKWVELGMSVPGDNYFYDSSKLKDIPFKDFDLNKSWKDFDIKDELTEKGLVRFATDWNSLIA